MYFIYKHTLNKKSYIGYTSKTIEARLEDHVTEAKFNSSNRHFVNAISKYGSENIVTEQLEKVLSKSDALSREIYWIDFYNTFDSGYNMTRGGEGGDTFSKNPNKEVIREKLRKVWTGRKHSEESKRKMSVTAKTRLAMPQEVIDRAEAKRKIKRDAGNYFSPEGIEKLRQAGKRKVFTPVYKKKLSENAKTRPRVTCPHCTKTGIRNIMLRWHFDNCKLRGNLL